ncbi:hypothetical protein ABPG72_010704 [Tetrahymena utriculariae]
MNFLFLKAVIAWTLLVGVIRSQSINNCQKQGYLDCLDREGNCTSEKSQCANSCSNNNSCETQCCIGGFCLVLNECSPYNNHNQKQTQNKSRISMFLDHILQFLFVLAIISPIIFISLCKFKKLAKIENVQIKKEVQETEMPLNLNVSFKPYNMWQKTEPDYEQNQDQDSIFMQKNYQQQEELTVKSNPNNQEKQITISQFNTTIFLNGYKKQQSVSASFKKLNQLQNKSEIQ